MDDMSGKTNFERLQKLNINEMAAFLAAGLNIGEDKIAEWLAETMK